MGMDMLRHLDPGGTKNAFISPFSISSALTITANGARGSTLASMQAALHLKQISISDANAQYKQLNTSFNKQPVEYGEPKNAKEKLQLRIANGLFLQQKFALLPAFVQTAKDQYGATVQNVDFADPKTTDIVNGWVSQKTNKKIDKIVGKLSPAMRLIIANAVYFKAPWAHQFSENQTQPGPFHATAGNTIQMPMMHSQEHYLHGKLGALEVLRLPYVGTSLEMDLLLPSKGSSVEAALKGLNAGTWDKLMGSATSKEVALTMPKFKVEYGSSLKNALSEMGMKDAFSDAANFSGMSTTPLYISDVIHKTYLDVNEKGTEAAAATVVMMAESAAMVPQTPVPFVVDRPFIVAIRDSATKTIVFLGVIRDPRK
jgi:serpin B